ncbi:MAG: NAD-dependent epimerase/dehydratase family protein [Desulfovibrionaceae bacterium]
MYILVTGGAGYIGSACVTALAEEGHTPIIYDNFLTSHRARVSPFIIVKGDITDTVLLEKVFSKYSIDVVIHAAALLEPFEESFKNPEIYNKVNVLGTKSLLEAMHRRSVTKIILLSTAAVYGKPLSEYIDEKHVLSPVTPYAVTRKKMEVLLEEYSQRYSFSSVVLRLFSVAGADSSRGIGPPSNNLNFMNKLVRCLGDSGTSLTIYGDDYATVDGTALYDFVHVNDVIEAVIQVLYQFPEQSLNYIDYNIGSGKVNTLKEIYTLAQKMTQRRLNIVTTRRRKGDFPRRAADISRVKLLLNWQARHSSLEYMIDSVCRWYKE